MRRAGLLDVDRRPSVTDGSARRRARAAATFWRAREKPVIAEANVPPLKRPPARR